MPRRVSAKIGSGGLMTEVLPPSGNEVTTFLSTSGGTFGAPSLTASGFSFRARVSDSRYYAVSNLRLLMPILTPGQQLRGFGEDGREKEWGGGGGGA